ERILVIANLSRFAQFAQLDLTAYQGMTPVELFGRTDFPPVGEWPYQVMLGPHAFYWFSLEPQRVEAGAVGDVPELSLRDRELERALPAYLTAQRWFGARSRRIKDVSVIDSVPIADAVLKVGEVQYQTGDPDTYALPLCNNADGRVVDALGEPGFNHLLLEAIAHRRRFRGASGDVIALPTPPLSRPRGGADGLPPRLSSAEQTNNSVIFGERLILKLFRRVEDGLHPDLEMSRFLTDVGFPNIAPVAGTVLYRRDRRRTAALAMLPASVPTQGAAWSHVQTELSADGDAIDRYV